jgi:hypothetical protein
MKFANVTDKSLLTYHESVRMQLLADERLGGSFRLVGETVRQYTAELQEEMTRRQMGFTPIEWR